MKINFNYFKLQALKGVALSLVLVSPFTLNGCSETAECNVDSNHAHMYKNDSGYVRYIEDERLRYDGYDRNNNYISIEGKEDLYDFLTKKDLMRIDDNLEVIKKAQEKQIEYIEYRYKYTYMQPIPYTKKVGNISTTQFHYIPVTRYSWTNDPNHSRLTGETRTCHYTYVAYKVEKNEKGKYVLIPSEHVDDLTTVMDKYPYIKQNDSTIVTVNGKKADYEDGKQEDMSEVDNQRAKEYDTTHQEEKVKTYQKHK